MDTVRVDIAYRPLRIAFAIHSDDRASLRRVLRSSCAIWGGRFNPIVFVDRPDDASELVNVFRADLVWPIGDSDEVKEFPKRYPHLIDPLYGSLFLRSEKEPGRAHLLDIHNLLVRWGNAPEWKAWERGGMRRFTWEQDDPLADIFLMQFGDYPDVDETGLDYSAILAQATTALDERIGKDQPLPRTVLEHPSISLLTRFNLHRHYSVQTRWSYPGFYIGDASNVFDLVDYWNLRAADIRLMFLDPKYLERYSDVRAEYTKLVRDELLHRPEYEQNIAVWSRDEKVEEATKLFEGEKLTVCRIGFATWNGLNVVPPMMVLGDESSLGVFNKEQNAPRVSFAFKDKPYSGDGWFYSQHLVASIQLLGGLYGDDHHTFRLPYNPELNEFFARSMILDYDKLRVEPERVGLIIDAADHDSWLVALPAAELVKKTFDLVGIKAQLSGGGLITRQLISRLGGIRNARVFKIPGVRRLLKTHGPTAAFTKNAALGLIGGKDSKNPAARFSDYEQLYIEPRHDSKLTPAMVFGYLVAKGLFRIGAELKCSTCGLSSWTALDSLKQRVTCELCGDQYDATRQLVDGVFHYRRTGVLGLEKNTQGAVPVTLVLEQLTRNLWEARSGVYAASHDLQPKIGIDLPTCETDFVMILPGRYADKTSVVIGESKDSTNIDAVDIDNLRRIADAFPSNRFETYVVLTKLVDFTSEEIALAKSLNGPYRRRVILLTARELEPYRIYERHSKEELEGTPHGGTLNELAAVTHKLYFDGSSKK